MKPWTEIRNPKAEGRKKAEARSPKARARECQEWFGYESLDAARTARRFDQNWSSAMNTGFAHDRTQPTTVAQFCNLLRKLDGLANPKGIVSLSPGLRGASYPGCALESDLNPERVVSSVTRAVATPMALRRKRVAHGCEATLTGLAVLSVLKPRVARASQPWAERSHPFRMTADLPRL
jgi:hypothetical protein